MPADQPESPHYRHLRRQHPPIGAGNTFAGPLPAPPLAGTRAAAGGSLHTAQAGSGQGSAWEGHSRRGEGTPH